MTDRQIEKQLVRRHVIFKVHLVMHHLSEYIEEEGMSMGLFSEQTGESLHSDFDQTWAHYRVKNVCSKNYSNQLLRAIMAYNSAHV